MKITNHNYNNFDFIRFMASVLVIESHSTQLTGIGISYVKLLTKSVSLGNLCVDVFFMVSGYLILASYLRISNTRNYLIARALRIYPGLIIAVLITSLVIVPFIIPTTLEDYYKDHSTWLYLLNAIMPLSEMISNINGFNTGTHNIYSPVVNGALWTIGWEIKCYFLIIILSLVQLLRHRLVILISTIALLLLYNFYYNIDAFRFYSLFMTGMCFYLFRDKIAFNNKLLTILSVSSLIISCYFGVIFDVIFAISGGYLLFSFAFNPKVKLNNFGKYGDFSYGIYLYGFFIQQILIILNNGKMDNVLNFILALPIAILCGILSYYLIEKPCIRLKTRFIH